jgi:putative addiction module component (TIGR02574 family)
MLLFYIHAEYAMSPTLQDLGIDQLSTDDRLLLAEAIWESVAREIEQAPLPDEHRQELERRLADSIARPDEVTPWEIIKARALARA